MRLLFLVCSFVRFISGGFGFRAIFSSGPPPLNCSVAMQFAATVGFSMSSPLVTFSHLLIPLRRKVIRGRAIAR